jgi:hypothetical protein
MCNVLGVNESSVANEFIDKWIIRKSSEYRKRIGKQIVSNNKNKTTKT